MVAGLSLETFTQLHVAVSLIAIVLGIAALYTLQQSQRPGWIVHSFLVTTALTVITGFMFPVDGFTPAVGVGMVTTICLWPAFFGLYLFKLAGVWRPIFVVTATVALYLNCFVLVVQAFQKVSILSALAPTQSEPPFLIAQAAVLFAFLYFGWKALQQFHPPAPAAA